jgi:hypothetical protein
MADADGSASSVTLEGLAAQVARLAAAVKGLGADADGLAEAAEITGSGPFFRREYQEMDSVGARGVYSAPEFRAEQLADILYGRRTASQAHDQIVQAQIRQQQEQHSMYLRHQEQNHLLWTSLFAVVLNSLTANQSSDQGQQNSLTAALAQIMEKMAGTTPPVTVQSPKTA